MTVNLEVPGRVLAIGAHPDDVEFGAGATLAKWAEAGAEVHLLVLTDGSKGSWDTTQDVDALVEVRKQEAQLAAGGLGARDVHFLNEVDGELDSGLVVRAGVCRAIRRVAPDVVLGHDPWKRYRLHPDHRHAGFLTLDGVVAARDPHFFPDEGRAHRPRTVLLFEAEQPDHHEAVDEYLDRKVAALLAHRSQWRSTMGIGDDVEAGRAALDRRIREEAAEAGRSVGLPAAEAFKRIDEV